ncbi:MAG: NUDIX hydrolase [Thermotogota bacterium]
MRYAISAGAIVAREGALLVVHHLDSRQDFWVPPGGRLRGEESIFDCARRETYEETGLNVVPERVVYIEEFLEGDLHFCKFWILARAAEGSPTVEHRDPDEGFVVEACFASRGEMADWVVHPAILKGLLWDDLQRGFPKTRYLGLQRIE